MAEALVRVVKQVRDELKQLSSKAVSITRSEKSERAG
jgi:hypothetical protein